eukprot:COSAG01_NODE_18475_length_1073_cov_1.410678_1_plen_87_part_10
MLLLLLLLLLRLALLLLGRHHRMPGHHQPTRCAATAALALEATLGVALLSCSQKGYLSSRGGCQNRWHSLVNGDHGDSTTSRLDSPS